MSLLPAAPTSVTEAAGLAVAEEITAPHAVPPFPNSAMDGYAVVAADTLGAPVILDVLEDVSAGSVPTRVVSPGRATRIMTGAPMPEGADAVVMVEDTESLPDGKVRIGTVAAVGAHIRRAGGDLEEGDTVLRAGTRLGPVHVGLLAAIGVVEPVVHRRPVVSVLSTGDEVMPPDIGELAPGQIRDSNRPLLVALLGELGVEVRDLGIVPDDARLLRATLEEAAASCDAVLTSGGVSMGDYDLVKQVLTEVGQVEFWRVAMQPAKPFAFGFLGDTPLFGLPGNPVSVVVAFEQFVRPALLRRMGAELLFRPSITVTMGEDVRANDEKVVFLRVSLSNEAGGTIARLSGGQGSHVLSALAAADGLAVIPVGVGAVAAGDRVQVELLRAAEVRSHQEVLG